MGSEQSFVDFVCEQAGLGEALSARKMFGEYALYLDGKLVALVCDNQLFVKPTEPGRALLGTVQEYPPYPGAKPHFRLVEQLEDREALAGVLRATAAALPMPMPKPKPKSKPKAGTKTK